MTKKGRRRKNSKDENYDIDDDDADNNAEVTGATDLSPTTSSKNNKDMSFAERRELQRKDAADKRRLKMKVRAMRCVETFFLSTRAYY